MKSIFGLIHILLTLFDIIVKNITNKVKSVEITNILE